MECVRVVTWYHIPCGLQHCVVTCYHMAWLYSAWNVCGNMLEYVEMCENVQDCDGLCKGCVGNVQGPCGNVRECAGMCEDCEFL